MSKKSSLYERANITSGDSIAGDFVYICTGSSSKKYHCDDECRGLENCQGDVEMVTLEEAEDEGRRECKICYDDY